MKLKRREWLESLDYVIAQKDPDRVRTLMPAPASRVRQFGIEISRCTNKPSELLISRKIWW